MAKKFNVAATRSAFRQRMRASRSLWWDAKFTPTPERLAILIGANFSGSVTLTEGGLENELLVGDSSHLVGPVVPNVPGGISHGAFIRNGLGGLIEPIEGGLADDVGRGVDACHV